MFAASGCSHCSGGWILDDQHRAKLAFNLSCICARKPSGSILVSEIDDAQVDRRLGAIATILRSPLPASPLNMGEPVEDAQSGEIKQHW